MKSAVVGLLLTLSVSGCEVDTPVEVEMSSELNLIGRVDHLDTLAREPMLAVHPDGAMFVSGFGSQVTATDWTQPPPVFRSDDNGETWSRVDVGSSEDGAQGNSDVDFAVGPDGEIYLAALGFNRATSEGTQVAIGVSRDVGKTWQWQFLSNERFDDRPWVAVSGDGTVHVIWNNDGGVMHTASDDAGASWRTPKRVSNGGGSSHLAVDDDGRVAIRISALFASGKRFDADADAIAVSLDQGETWSVQSVPGDIEWQAGMPDASPVPRWVEPLAWSGDGRLHHVWSEGHKMRHGVSTDFGKSWHVDEVAIEDGTAFFPYLISDGDDTLAASWFVMDEENLCARVAQIVLNDGGTLRQVALSNALVPESWKEDRSIRQPTTAGEYLGLAFFADGDIAVVSPIQDIHNDRWGFTFWHFGEQK